jgi:microcin C transport system permease protein
MSTAYILRRLLLMIPTFLGVTLMVFAVTRFVPGGPVERALQEAQAMADQGDSEGSGSDLRAGALSEDQIQMLNEYYGFDKPILVSYWNWLKKLVVLDLGDSTRWYEPVWETIARVLPVSTFYGLMSMLLAYLICIPLGIVKAIKHKSSLDSWSSILIFVGYAVPGFIVAVLLLSAFSFHLEWFPAGGFVSDEFEDLSFVGKIGDLFYHAALPLIAYTTGSFAVMTMLMKNSLMDNLAADYVRTAMAKGFTFKAAVFRHALQNSLIPLATHFGSNISFFIGGSFLIEKIFDIDGFGLLGFESIVERDYPVVMGILAISCALQLLGNLLSDVSVAAVDPRVQFQ